MTFLGQSLSLPGKQVDLLIPASADAERLAQVEALAVEVFENRAAAISWLTSPNIALGGKSPHSLCSTDFGATQVRGLLHCIEYGGVV